MLKSEKPPREKERAIPIKIKFPLIEGSAVKDVVIILIISASAVPYIIVLRLDPSPLKYSNFILSFPFLGVFRCGGQPVSLVISSNIQPFFIRCTDFMAAISKYLTYPDKLLVNKCILMRTKNSSSGRKWKSAKKEEEGEKRRARCGASIFLFGQFAACV